jgi:hypothetical protein
VLIKIIIFFSKSKEKKHTTHTRTHTCSTHTHTHMLHAHSTPPCTHTCTPHAHNTDTHHAHSMHTPRTHHTCKYTVTHAHKYNACTHTSRTPHTCKQHKKLRAKEGNQFEFSFFGAGVVVSAKHISSTPKGESSSTVELQIGGVAAPELVWCSRSPPKHALILI